MNEKERKREGEGGEGRGGERRGGERRERGGKRGFREGVGKEEWRNTHLY